MTASGEQSDDRVKFAARAVAERELSPGFMRSTREMVGASAPVMVA
jgi:hypothetical protein